MRLALLFALLGLVQIVINQADDGSEKQAAKEAGAEDADEFEDDPEPQSSGPAEDPSAEADEVPVEEFDLGMTQDERGVRMRICLFRTMARAQSKRDQLQQSAAEIVKNDPQYNMEQIVNNIVFTWMMQCYINADDSGALEVQLETPLTEEQEVNTFDTRIQGRQQVRYASKRQWALLQQTVEDQSKNERKMQEDTQTRGRGNPLGGGPLGGSSPSTQALYVLVMFGTIFGLCALAVSYLMRGGERTKSRKQEKAEKKLSKKTKAQ